ncbi:lipoprotein-releasing ABC transporter permease subunit [Pseudomonadales bacterium]|nr:lipoprotein-releasing ABC transporter permease subunit [Pseudomonadales bacterium]MDB4528794.1 lipoprotein-releasing ABC transporter permease subunit [Pseudomonadales bacterium]
MPNLHFSRTLAARYSLPYLNRGLTGFLSFISLAGLALAVFALVLVISVMNGFERELQSRMLALLPHATVDLPGGHQQWGSVQQDLANQPGVVASAPYIEGQVLLTANGNLASVALVGIDVGQEAGVSSLPAHMLAGDLNRLADTRYQMVLGRYLARQLGLSIGDKLNIILPRVQITPMGPVTRQRQFTVAGVFEVGAELDQTLALTDLSSANKLFAGAATVDGLRLAVDNQYAAASITELAIAALSAKGLLSADTPWSDWREKNATLYSAVVMEKIMIFVLLMAVVAVASFNVISIVLLTVTDKKTDIAVLRTMGASAQQIMQLFMLQGALIGTAGTLVGALLGMAVAPNIGAMLLFVEKQTGWQLFDPSVYFIPYLPSLLRWQDVLLVVVAGISISLLVTLFPAMRAAKINPVVALASAH